MELELNDIMLKILPCEFDKNNLLIKNINELEKTFESLQHKCKFCYFYRDKIHQIIYDGNSIINIEDVLSSSDIFYLVLSITEDTTYINYSYNFDLINQIYNENRQEKNELKIVINANNIKKLITNFEGLDIPDSDEINNKIKQIKKEN